MIPIYDEDSGQSQSIYSANFIQTSTSAHSYFWEKPKVYAEEHRLCSSIPAMRLLNTVLCFFMVYVGIDFILGLCTNAMEFICSVALVFTTIYWFWATW